MPRIRLGALAALAGDWPRVARLLAAPEDADSLENLHALWKPKLRVALAPTTSPEKLSLAARQFVESALRFNRRWQRFVDDLKLTSVNEERAAYNRYYVLEKECALRSAQLARQGFRPLPPVTTDDILREFPLIRVPEFRD